MESQRLVVIFRAHIKAVDEQYAATAARKRELALTRFGCLAFHAVPMNSRRTRFRTGQTTWKRGGWES
jgi:hypothetical protein